MADLQQELDSLLTAYEEKTRLYNLFAEASQAHNKKILELAESQPIDVLKFEEAETLYDEMVLSEKTYRIQREVFSRSREEIIAKLTPVQNIKIKFEYTNEKKKETTDYYVWLKYNAENPDESQLVLQKISEDDNEPTLL